MPFLYAAVMLDHVIALLTEKNEKVTFSGLSKFKYIHLIGFFLRLLQFNDVAQA